MLVIALPAVLIKGNYGKAKGEKTGWLVNWKQ